MKKLVITGMIAAVLAVVPALAFQQETGAMDKPMTRMDVEKKIQDHFSKADTDHDGFITKDEAKAMHAQRQTEHRGKMFTRIDSDGNGSISRAEFDAHVDSLADMGRKRPMMVQRRQMKGPHAKGGGGMFKKADTDNDGRLSFAEAVKGHMAMFDRADADKNGMVTPEEHKAMMMACCAKHRGRPGN